MRGGKVPNYDAGQRRCGLQGAAASGLQARLMVDFSHANSSKQFQAPGGRRPRRGQSRWPGRGAHHRRDGRVAHRKAARTSSRASSSSTARASPTPASAGKTASPCSMCWPRPCASVAPRAARSNSTPPGRRCRGGARPGCIPRPPAAGDFLASPRRPAQGGFPMPGRPAEGRAGRGRAFRAVAQRPAPFRFDGGGPRQLPVGPRRRGAGCCASRTWTRRARARRRRRHPAHPRAFRLRMGRPGGLAEPADRRLPGGLSSCAPLARCSPAPARARRSPIRPSPAMARGATRAPAATACRRARRGPCACGSSRAW